MAMNEIQTKAVLTAFYNVMREHPLGVNSDLVAKYLTNKINFEFNFKNFGCYSLLEFLKKFIMPTIDIEIITNNTSENEVFMIRSKQFLSYESV
jgi:hypothetical protein